MIYLKTEKFSVTGMTCAACQANVTRCVQKLEGVDNVDVNLLSRQMTVKYDEERISSGSIEAAVTGIGYGASSLEKKEEHSSEGGFRGQWQARQQEADDETKGMRTRLISSVILLVPLMYVAMGSMLHIPVPPFLTGIENALISAITQMIITIPILFINRKFFQTGLRSLLHLAPNMDSLVAIGSGAALVYGLFSMYRMAWGFGHGDMEAVHQYAHALYFESSAMILTLVTVGKYLEAKSKAKTSDALGKLVDLAPKTAVVVRNGREETVPAEQVASGDTVVIRPGEAIPVDGVLTEGYGYVDQSAITGESIPVEKRRGDQVISATINRNGTFRFTASRVGEDTTLAQIIRLVDEAGNSKAPIARLADKVSGIFVPVVILIAILTAIIWTAAGQGFESALSNAIAVLVISCPCALGLATPVAIMVGTGKAAEMGILIKSAESLENLHNIDTIVLDKTGTITTGRPSVTDVIMLDHSLSSEEFLREAAAAEKGSEHPLAQAVVEKAEELGLEIPAAADFSAVAGRGIRATVEGNRYAAGNRAFMAEQGIETGEETTEKLASEGKTPLIFARNGKPAGIIGVADTVKESSISAVERFRAMGIDTVMLTGDNRVTAEAIRKQLAIGDVIAEVLPAEKEAAIRGLQDRGHKVAMVGDGINDAPALMRADIGIAIGAGTDIAVESADIVLMKDSLEDVAEAIALSRAVVKNIHMNLFWAFFYNILGIPVAAGALFPAFGISLSPMIGSAAMSMSSVCVVTNALRLRFFGRKDRCDMTGNDPEQTKGVTNMKKILKIDGMMCQHCQMNVEKALAAVEGVERAVVDLDKKEAEVSLSKDVDDSVLTGAVSEAGYTPVSCADAD